MKHTAWGSVSRTHTHTHTHTHTCLESNAYFLFNAPESCITAPNMAALWHREPASARTSYDSCGAQHNDKKRDILCASYTYENFVEFHYNIAEGIFFNWCPSFSTLFFYISTIACTPIQQMNSVVPHHAHNGITGCLSRTKRMKIWWCKVKAVGWVE